MVATKQKPALLEGFKEMSEYLLRKTGRTFSPETLRKWVTRHKMPTEVMNRRHAIEEEKLYSFYQSRVLSGF